MKLRDLNLGDIMTVCCDLRSDDWDQVEKFVGKRDVDTLINQCFNFAGPKWAFVNEHDIAVVVGGFIPIRAGVYQTWFLVSKRGWSYSEAVTAMAAERLDFMMKNGAHRLETLCLASRKKALTWYGMIGLEFEATLKQFCVDGSDAVLYVRVSNVLA